MKPLHLGTWISTGSPVVTELASFCGLQWLLFDMEHGAITEADLLSLLRSARGTFSVVRVPSHDLHLIGRVLDAGADAIMVPHVESKGEAERLVAAMHYPPRGVRGFSRTVRATEYGMKSLPPQPLLYAQIESATALENVDAIAAVPGVDLLFVGPADLQLSLSHSSGAPDFETALCRISEAAARFNKETGILVRDLNDTQRLVNQGFTRIAIDSDLALLRKGFLSIVALQKELIQHQR